MSELSYFIKTGCGLKSMVANYICFMFCVFHLFCFVSMLEYVIHVQVIKYSD